MADEDDEYPVLHCIVPQAREGALRLLEQQAAAGVPQSDALRSYATMDGQPISTRFLVQPSPCSACQMRLQQHVHALLRTQAYVDIKQAYVGIKHCHSAKEHLRLNSLIHWPGCCQAKPVLQPAAST